MEKDLDKIAEELFKCRTLLSKQDYLINNGREQHIKEKSGLSWALSTIDPERFINVGSFFYYRKDSDSEKKYKKICLINGKFLYENYPLIFEFYDEWLNGYTYENINDIIKQK